MSGEEPAPLGLAQGTVSLNDSDARWPELYRLEAERLRGAIGHLVLDIQHIGSTAISGIKAKPILDIALALPRFEDGPLLVAPLEALGYDYVGIDMVPNDHLFGLGAPRTHLVHGVVHNGYHWNRFIRFRDRMRAEPMLAASYEALKVDLAARFADRRADYTAAKAAFIDSIADA